MRRKIRLVFEVLDLLADCGDVVDVFAAVGSQGLSRRVIKLTFDDL